ncbi:MAG: 4Fe-4S dicluster domain-containing protein, partial [Betaproteobacteria bacterium]|nr:4Fe-4S dicluster domain-containing protein [Betaproteobacteria bacterium]
KALFDPKGLMNPGKIVRPTRQDDRSLFRYAPGYATPEVPAAFDWSAEFGERGLAAAVEMCNNNGHCRKFDAGTMCPSYRVTRDEAHLTRGRANTLRLALSNQIEGGFASVSVKEAMELCVSCKGCKRECPTGIDMAKMKIEFLHQYKKQEGYTLRDKLVGYLPRYAPVVSKVAWLANLLEALPGAMSLREVVTGISARRSLPRWSSAKAAGSIATSIASEKTSDGNAARGVVLFADTFNRYFENENIGAAKLVLEAAGYAVHFVAAGDSSRPLCCGRTFLATGMIELAKEEARRTLDALQPFVARNVPVVGLEPSCLLTLRDEFISLFPGQQAQALAKNAFLFEEFLVREKAAGRLQLALGPIESKSASLHGHCHQKAFDAMGATEEVLSWIPELKTSTIESSCCGMAGAFGYEAEHYDISMKMGELALLPAVRGAPAETLIVADGTSCRHQIADGTGRAAVHVAVVLASALA